MIKNLKKVNTTNKDLELSKFDESNDESDE